MNQSKEKEITDDPNLSEDIVIKVRKDLFRTHKLLGTVSAIVQQIKKGSIPKSILDISCGDGQLLLDVGKNFQAQLFGAEFRPPKISPSNLNIIKASAISDQLPPVDLAICVFTFHHFSPEEIQHVILNVSRSAKRFIIVDLVRSWFPLILFTLFVAPFLYRINRLDGILSIKRSYTSKELFEIISSSLKKTDGTFKMEKVFFRTRQIVDITFRT